MANERKWVTTKDVNTRVGDFGKQGRGGSTIRYIGKGTESGEYYRMFMEFDEDFSGMSDGRILSAKLFFTTNEDGPWSIGSDAEVVVHRSSQEWDNDGSDDFHSGGYVNPSCDTAKSWRSTFIPTTPNQPFSIDITGYVQLIAPRSVDVLLGAKYVAGQGATYKNKGLRIRTPNENNSQQRIAVWSDDGSTPSTRRPYVSVMWEPKNTKPVTTWGQPLGSSSSLQRYQGTYFDAQGQRIKAAQVQVWRSSDNDPSDEGEDDPTRHNSDKVYWEQSWPDGQYDLPPAPEGRLPKYRDGNLITYRGRARTWDSQDEPSDWTPMSAGVFTIASASPTVTCVAMMSQSDLQNVKFKAPWTYDPTATRVTSYRVQLTNRFDTAWGQVLWDKTFIPTAQEQADKKASFSYGGPTLVAGDYRWRIFVTDALGEDSVWSEDSTLVLTAGQVYPDDPNDTTQYGRQSVTTRLVMRDVDKANNRRPGKVVAIVEDPKNLAASGYATTPGQISFSLHNDHPQISVMEPMRTHWSLQQYRGSQWRELSAGMLTDFDATENDTIFTGLDYLGMLSLSIEAQSQPPGIKNAELQWSKGGAKYYKKTIGYIIKNQLQRAISSTHSPLGFFTIPAGGVDTMSEVISIHSAFVQRLDFIRGLIDSHRGSATGRRSRITAARNVVSGLYEFTVRSNAGRDRANIKLSYGSIVQGYRVMALGDWGDKVYGVGRLRNQLQPYFRAMAAPNFDISDWGEIAKAAVWQDVADLDDLQRRARTMATEMSRAGKRIALGLRVNGILLLDGWNICDNVQIDIEDGTVATSRYGTNGWWTIQGWEWRLYPDGHDELTLVIKPREDVTDPIDDLIPGEPIHIQPEWTVKHGPP